MSMAEHVGLRSCDINDVEEMAIRFFCEYGLEDGWSLERFMSAYAMFNEFLQDNYPDNILTTNAIETWVNVRRTQGIPEIKA